MIDKQLLIQTITDKLVETDCFLVEVSISAANDIVVEIDSEKGVDLDVCVALSRHIEAIFDREKEDYALEVGSSGLTSPFKTLRQYEKNLERDIEVVASDGRKHRGKLKTVTPEWFVIEEETRMRREGDKRKKTYITEVTFTYRDIKSAKASL
ncbi:MAG: ribosome assembly cofactor RimP [Prevotellaceae bacterium]|nr:ribosome assembly cofactor RimP [Prevotellaceae bacterium]